MDKTDVPTPADAVDVAMDQPEPVAEPPPTKAKGRRGMTKPITEEQRQHLAKARERASEALRTKAELTRLEKVAKKQTQAERLAELRKKVSPPPEPEQEPEPSEQVDAAPEPKTKKAARRRAPAKQESSDDSDESSDSDDGDTGSRRYREKYRARYAARYASRSIPSYPPMIPMMMQYPPQSWPQMSMPQPPPASPEPVAKPQKHLHEIARQEVKDRVNNEVLRMAFRSVFPGAESSPYDQ
jgi:hypothetical protein